MPPIYRQFRGFNQYRALSSPEAKVALDSRMATIIPDVSRTFQEFLLLPGLTTKNHVPHRVSLVTPFGRRIAGREPRLALNIPLVSASMQAVSGRGSPPRSREREVADLYSVHKASNHSQRWFVM